MSVSGRVCRSPGRRLDSNAGDEPWRSAAFSVYAPAPSRYRPFSGNRAPSRNARHLRARRRSALHHPDGRNPAGSAEFAPCFSGNSVLKLPVVVNSPCANVHHQQEIAPCCVVVRWPVSPDNRRRTEASGTVHGVVLFAARPVIVQRVLPTDRVERLAPDQCPQMRNDDGGNRLGLTLRSRQRHRQPCRWERFHATTGPLSITLASEDRPNFTLRTTARPLRR